MKRPLLATVAAVTLAATPALAGENTTWKKLEHWRIGITWDTHDCYMMARYRNDATMLRFLINMADKRLDVLLFDRDWASLQSGQHYELKMQFDNQPVWSIPAHVAKMDDDNIYLSFYISDTNENLKRFAAEMAASQGVTFTYQEKVIVNWDIPGGGAAFQEMLTCEATTVKQHDPFQQPREAPSRDP
jgi:hypothetical protein